MTTTRSSNYRNKLAIASDEDNCLQILQTDGTEILAIDSSDDPTTLADFQANGYNEITGSGTNRTVVRAREKIGTGTQSGRLRGFDVVLVGSGDAVQSGTSGAAFRGLNASVAWQSTGTAAELVGLNDTVLVGAGAIAAGTVTVAACNKVRFGFQSVNSGAITDAYGYWVVAPKETDGTHTITNAYGLFIEDMALSGITVPYAIKTGSGVVEFGGRVQGAKGADVASATDITLGIDGNYFDITGTTQIDTIVATGWTAGSTAILQFDASVTVKHNTAGSGASILLAGAVDFSATADDTLQLAYDGVTWREISRTVI